MQKVDMRTLIFGGSAIVLAMIAWVLYLEHDKRQFIESLPKLPQSLRHHADSATERLAPLPENKGEQTEPETLETAIDILTTVPADVTERAEPGADTVFEEVFEESMPEVDDTGLSPELETLFSQYYTFTQQVVEVEKVLSPLLDTHVLTTQRIREILSEALPNAPDDAARQVLYDELDELRAWQEEVDPTIDDLQDERTRISEKRAAFLTAYGFSSWYEFEETYQDTYSVWASEQ